MFLKYLEGETSTSTFILVVGIDVINFRVCEEEEWVAHVDDEGAYMWWPHLPSLN